MSNLLKIESNTFSDNGSFTFKVRGMLLGIELDATDVTGTATVTLSDAYGNDYIDAAAATADTKIDVRNDTGQMYWFYEALITVTIAGLTGGTIEVRAGHLGT
jgi:hypothetical protein